MSTPTLSSTSMKDQDPPVMDNRVPTCRNYWRFGISPPAPQRPPSYLLKPHLIASSVCSEEGKNPNSKYYKLRHGPGAGQFSPLNEDLIGYHQYRVRLPFDPTPFRGITRFAFWIAFLSILVLLCILITSLLRVEDFHAHRHHDGGKPSHGHDHDYHNLGHNFISKEGSVHEEPGSLSNSLIFKTLVNRHLN